MKNTAIYARVSTRDQNPKTQLKELRAYAKRRRFRVAYELVEYESGAKQENPGHCGLENNGKNRSVRS